MKRFFITLIILALLGGGAYLLFPRQQEAATSDTLTIGATIYPLYDIARTVAGENADVVLVLPSGQSPHTFDPGPSVLKKLTEARVVYAIGHGIDDWVDTVASGAGDVPVQVVDEGIMLRENSITELEGTEEAEEHEDEHEEGGEDPHYWLDPKNGIRIAQTIATDLAERDPSHAAEYQANAATFAAQIDAADASWRVALTDVTTENVITFHDAFWYFAEHFNLRIVAALEPFPGKEPTPQALADLSRRVTQDNVRALFMEPQLSTDAIQAFAQDTGVPVAVLDPLGGVAGRETYQELITYNVDTFAQAVRQ